MRTFLILLQLASAGNDAYWTNYNQHLPRHYENNPVAAPFVGSTRGCIIYFSATTGAKLLAPPLLRKYHHKRLARFVELEGIADSAYAGVSSAVHSHDK